MPSYDYRCHDCQRRVTLTFKSFAAYDEATPTCPRCKGTNLTRWIRRVRVLKSDEARMAALENDPMLDKLEDADPATMGRYLRQMGEAAGEDLGPEFNEVIGRLERGEDPETIEADMPDLGGGDFLDD